MVLGQVSDVFLRLLIQRLITSEPNASWQTNAPTISIRKSLNKLVVVRARPGECVQGQYQVAELAVCFVPEFLKGGALPKVQK